MPHSSQWLSIIFFYAIRLLMQKIDFLQFDNA